MWKNWLSGILGFWVVIIPFLNFSLAWQRTVLIFSGVIIAIFGFWSFYETRLRRLPVDGQDLPADQHGFGETIAAVSRPQTFEPSVTEGAAEEKKIEI